MRKAPTDNSGDHRFQGDLRAWCGGCAGSGFPCREVAKKDGPTAVFYAGKRDSTADVPDNSGKIAEQNPATGIARSDADSVTFPAGTKFYVGNLAFLQERNISLPQGAAEGLNRMADEGMTPLLVAQEGRFLGIIGVSDTVKATSYEAINAWEKIGVRVIMLTGDNRRTAERTAKAWHLRSRGRGTAAG